MIQDVIRLVRGYTDGLFAGLTKSAKDGRKVVYFWGILGRGYIVATDEVEERLKQQYAILVIVATVFLGIAFSAGGFVGGLAALVLWFAGYAIYVKRLVAGMEPSDERLSLARAYAAAARGYSPRQLWTWLSCGILMIGIGIVVVATGQPGLINPEFGIFPELGIFFGFGILVTAFSGWMLLLRRGAGPAAAAPSPAVKSIVAEEAASYVTGMLGPVRAWFLAIFGLVFSGVGVALLLVDSESRSRETVGGVALFGIVAALGISQLVLRYRERHHP